MTIREEKEVIRVHGENYNYKDIPAYMRRRDAEALAEDLLEDEARRVKLEEAEGEADDILEGADSLEEAEEKLEEI